MEHMSGCGVLVVVVVVIVWFLCNDGDTKSSPMARYMSWGDWPHISITPFVDLANFKKCPAISTSSFQFLSSTTYVLNIANRIATNTHIDIEHALTNSLAFRVVSSTGRVFGRVVREVDGAGWEERGVLLMAGMFAHNTRADKRKPILHNLTKSITYVDDICWQKSQDRFAILAT